MFAEQLRHGLLVDSIKTTGSLSQSEEAFGKRKVTDCWPCHCLCSELLLAWWSR